jgi:hypothetical protein
MTPSYRKRRSEKLLERSRKGVVAKMTDATETWTVDEWREYNRTGFKPVRASSETDATPNIDGLRPASAVEQSENQLQDAVEKWLRQRGYLSMTEKNAAKALREARTPNPNRLRGFFGYWHECRTNPQISDLLIVPFPNNKPALFLELKVKNKWQAGQKAWLALAIWALAWTLEEAQEIVTTWEGEE